MCVCVCGGQSTNETALDYVVRIPEKKRHLEIATLLLEYGADATPLRVSNRVRRMLSSYDVYKFRIDSSFPPFLPAGLPACLPVCVAFILGMGPSVPEISVFHYCLPAPDLGDCPDAAGLRCLPRSHTGGASKLYSLSSSLFMLRTLLPACNHSFHGSILCLGSVVVLSDGGSGAAAATEPPSV